MEGGCHTAYTDNHYNNDWYLLFWSNLGGKTGKYPGKYPDLLEGFYVIPTTKSAKSREIFRKFEPKWLITPLVNKVNTPKVNA